MSKYGKSSGSFFEAPEVISMCNKTIEFVKNTRFKEREKSIQKAIDYLNRPRKACLFSSKKYKPEKEATRKEAIEHIESLEKFTALDRGYEGYIFRKNNYQTMIDLCNDFIRISEKTSEKVFVSVEDFNIISTGT